MNIQHELNELGKQLDVIELRKAFDPNEARDIHGRWSGSNQPKQLKLIEAGRSVAGSSLVSYNIQNEGKKIASLVLNVENKDHPFVEWVGKDLEEVEDESMDPYANPVKLGPSIVRDIARQLYRLYPNAKTIAGERVSGARVKSGKPDQQASVRTNLIKQLQLDLAKVERKLIKLNMK